MSTNIDYPTKRRLVYVKKLYFHAHEHISHQTEFDRMIAIHNLDNAVELLLKCVAIQKNIKLKKPLFIYFPELWKAIDRTIPLPKKTEMFQLHAFRNDVQHWGVSPLSSEFVTRFDVYVSDFIKAVLKQVFDIEFDELFMASLVEDTTLRKILTIAEEAFEKRDYKKCMLHAIAAFSRAKWEHFDELNFRPPLMRELIDNLAEDVTILKLGIDYLTYRKYKKIAPSAYWDDEEENVKYARPIMAAFDEEEGRKVELKMFSKEKALFTFNFVLNCILQWKL
ncbi:MAG: hypothetical protein NWF06_03760 [Candidatus Bathyarchaeota archaeon]|nr:hypothetical protein [Candidatus Bathyarchaeum sp.]